MSRIASSNLFDILIEDDAAEEVVKSVAAAPAAGAAKAGKKPAAAVPAQPAPGQKARNPEPAKDAPAEDPNFNRQNRGGSPQKGRPPRENTKNDRHVSRNGGGRDISKGGGGRGNWGNEVDENRPQGPNSKKIAEEPIVAEAEPAVAAAEPSAAVAASADGAAPAGDAPVAEPEKPKEPDPADKFIGLDEFLAQKEAKRVAEDNQIKIRDVIVDDKQFKHIKVATSEKDHVENDFSDLKVAKKGKKEKGASKRAQNEAIDLYPVGAVNNSNPPPARNFDRPHGDRPPRTGDGEFRGSPRGRGGFRGGRGGQRGRPGGRGTNLRDEDFPSLVGAPVQ